MPTLICQRCHRRMVWGLLSAQAWLEHQNGDGTRKHVCPDCRAEMNEEQQRVFTEAGALDRKAGS